MEYLLGIDLGSSSTKASLLEIATGKCAGSCYYPKSELEIESPLPGFAEQDPQRWYNCARASVMSVMEQSEAPPSSVKAIGISYQMHGLVCVDKSGAVLRPAIIWCDSRAVEIGREAFEKIGQERCYKHLLNSPGNFTASKLKWVKDNEPGIFERIHKIMLPGDWLAYKLTGEICTTPSGLSEGIFFDYLENEPCGFLMEHYGFNSSLLPRQTQSFGIQGELTDQAASEFGLKPGTPISYRSGDQPNNAFSLNVLNPGEVAATSGTSAAIYGVSDKKKFDTKSRVNSFLHVNHTSADPRLGILLCLNGAGIMNAWMKRLIGSISYIEMDRLAASAPIGSEGLMVFPFGNGSERMFSGQFLGAQLLNIDFVRHDRSHILRAVQEGIAFSLMYGIEIMNTLGVQAETIRAGHANMFLSETFSMTLANITGAHIEIYETDGALGAARGAGIGAGYYGSFKEAFLGLDLRNIYVPKDSDQARCAYLLFKDRLINKELSELQKA